MSIYKILHDAIRIGPVCTGLRYGNVRAGWRKPDFAKGNDDFLRMEATTASFEFRAQCFARVRPGHDEID